MKCKLTTVVRGGTDRIVFKHNNSSLNWHMFGCYLVMWYLNQNHCRSHEIHYSLTSGYSTWGRWQFFLQIFLDGREFQGCLSGKGGLVQKRLRTTTFTDEILTQFCSAWIQCIYSTCNFFSPFGNPLSFFRCTEEEWCFLVSLRWVLEVERWWGTRWLRRWWHLETFICRLLFLTQSWNSLPFVSFYVAVAPSGLSRVLVLYKCMVNDSPCPNKLIVEKTRHNL